MTQLSLWHDLYKSALLELDRGKLPGRMESARAAMRQRIAEITKGHTNDGKLEEDGFRGELRSIEDGLRALETLERIELTASLGSKSSSENEQSRRMS